MPAWFGFAGKSGKTLPPGLPFPNVGRLLPDQLRATVCYNAFQSAHIGHCGLEVISALLKILYIGSVGPLSTIPLQRLLGCGESVVAVAVAADHASDQPQRSIPVMTEQQGSIVSLARLHTIPIIVLSSSWTQSANELAKYAPDIIVVSCFAQKLPESVLSIPLVDCFNLHPSLLPAFRGPAPLFWQFRAGVEQFGITLHRMSAQFDSGDIIAQSRVFMPDGASGKRASELLAEAGGELLIQTLSNTAAEEWGTYPQDAQQASYQGFPSPSDYEVSVSWPARRLYNFICATRDRGLPYRCKVDDRVYWLLAVDSWQQTSNSGVVISGNTITIPCGRGSVTARFQAD